MSEASEGERAAGSAEDLRDLLFQLSETVGDHSDRVGLVEARRRGSGGAGDQQDGEYGRQRDLASHVSLSLSLSV